MRILEQELLWEHDLFHLINGSSSPLMDAIMWLFSGSVIWIPVGMFFLFSICYKKRFKEWLPILIAIALVVLLADQFSASVCKPLFARLRPTHHPLFMDEVQTLFNYRGGRHGFISSHACNFFGFATLTSLIFKQRVYSIVIYVWAFFVAYSRVYLGVHFISDVVAGAIVGISIGFLVYRFYHLVLRKAPKQVVEPVTAPQYAARNISLVLILNTVVFSLFSENIVHWMQS